MKKTYLYIALLMGASTLFSSCSDFLDREPITAPNNESFLSGESQVRGYINGLYTALPSLQKFGMGVRGEEKNSDNILSEISHFCKQFIDINILKISTAGNKNTILRCCIDHSGNIPGTAA